MMSDFAVTEITVSRTSGLLLTWDDGLTASIPLSELRASCPCAGCLMARNGDSRPPADNLTISHVELHGSWGLAITWSDGHNAGIHSLDVLRRHAEAAHG